MLPESTEADLKSCYLQKKCILQHNQLEITNLITNETILLLISDTV